MSDDDDKEDEEGGPSAYKWKGIKIKIRKISEKNVWRPRWRRRGGWSNRSVLSGPLWEPSDCSTWGGEHFPHYHQHHQHHFHHIVWKSDQFWHIIICTEGVLRRPMTYGDHPIHPSHPNYLQQILPPTLSISDVQTKNKYITTNRISKYIYKVAH